MRRSRFFMPTLKEVPSEAQIPSHRLMLRAGMIRQMSSGIYTWLPLGLRVLKRIEQIVREEQNRAGAQEVLMPTIQSADLWRESGRFDDYGEEMLRMVDRHGRDMLYGPTNEEMITDVFRNTVRSYRDLPLNLYHIQWKFRDEIRPRFGVMRGREFLMKDAYSFDLDYDGARKSYFDMMVAYLRTFARMGMRAIPLRANPGAIGGDLSHEFHIVAETGEGELFYDKAFDDVTVADMQNADLDLAMKLEGMYARADEEHDPANCPIADADLRHARGVEVGHIFYFGTKYSASMGAMVTNAEGQQVPVEMGSYGVGVSRLVGGIIEASHDDAGIIWPKEVAPFDAGLINIRPDDAGCADACEKLYADMTAAGLDVLYDERDERPGGKFAEMDLIGLPWQVVVGPRGLANGMIEVKHRASGDKQDVPLADVLARVKG